MKEQFDYKSIFAPYFNGFLEMKRALGFGLLKYKWKFLEFDKFFINVGVSDICILPENILPHGARLVLMIRKVLCMINILC